MKVKYLKNHHSTYLPAWFEHDLDNFLCERYEKNTSSGTIYFKIDPKKPDSFQDYSYQIYDVTGDMLRSEALYDYVEEIKAELTKEYYYLKDYYSSERFFFDPPLRLHVYNPSFSIRKVSNQEVLADFNFRFQYPYKGITTTKAVYKFKDENGIPKRYSFSGLLYDSEADPKSFGPWYQSRVIALQQKKAKSFKGNINFTRKSKKQLSLRKAMGID